jgi:folate-dependent phosphoribosylglycinamide formyltransferase PurN
MIYNELVAQFGLFPAIIEDMVPRAKMLKIRMRKVGFARVFSQMGFVALVRPWLTRSAKPRLKVLRRLHGLEVQPPKSSAIYSVDSVNGPACHELIERFKPDVVVINGTRILNRKTLARLSAKVINTHQGITPGYRGAHGAYWALAKGDREHCGVTIHLVDEGIDTGNIIAQAVVSPDLNDNFVTYPFLQTATALDPLVKSVRAACDGNLQTVPISGASMVWYHPGFFEYLGNAMRGVR